MSATFTWSVVSLNCQPSSQGQTNVVSSVDWKCVGTEVNGTTTYTSTQTGNIGVPFDGTSPFTPYAQLTQDQVLAWCYENGVNKDATQIACQNDIDNQINPPIITPALPWATTQAGA